MTTLTIPETIDLTDSGIAGTPSSSNHDAVTRRMRRLTAVPGADRSVASRRMRAAAVLDAVLAAAEQTHDDADEISTRIARANAKLDPQARPAALPVAV